MTAHWCSNDLGNGGLLDVARRMGSVGNNGGGEPGGFDVRRWTTVDARNLFAVLGEAKCLRRMAGSTPR